MKNHEVCRVPEVLEGSVDTRWESKTIYNHYEHPRDFMEDVIRSKELSSCSSKALEYIESGEAAFKRISKKDTKYSTLYKDVAQKVKDKLKARGFTTKMLYSSVEFTTENTGVLSKQRVLLGKRDCYFKNPQMTDGKLFHDIVVNLSYPASIDSSTITKNSYALYALVKELSRLIAIRVIVVNHVGTDIPTCYSYVLKKFGLPINPEEFLFFTGDSKRTFGWATYDILNGGDSNNSTVGEPTGSVSIDKFSLDIEIDKIFEKVKLQAPKLFKGE